MGPLIALRIQANKTKIQTATRQKGKSGSLAARDDNRARKSDKVATFTERRTGTQTTRKSGSVLIWLLRLFIAVFFSLSHQQPVVGYFSRHDSTVLREPSEMQSYAVAATENIPIGHESKTVNEGSLISKFRNISLGERNGGLRKEKHFSGGSGIGIYAPHEGSTCANRVVSFNLWPRSKKGHSALFKKSRSGADVFEMTANGEWLTHLNRYWPRYYSEPSPFLLLGHAYGSPSFVCLPANYDARNESSDDEPACIACDLPLYFYIFLCLFFLGVFVCGLFFFYSLVYI